MEELNLLVVLGRLSLQLNVVGEVVGVDGSEPKVTVHWNFTSNIAMASTVPA